MILSSANHVRTKRNNENANTDTQRTIRTQQDHFIDLQNRGIQVLAFKNYRWIFYKHFNHKHEIWRYSFNHLCSLLVQSTDYWTYFCGTNLLHIHAHNAICTLHNKDSDVRVSITVNQCLNKSITESDLYIHAITNLKHEEY